MQIDCGRLTFALTLHSYIAPILHSSLSRFCVKSRASIQSGYQILFDWSTELYWAVQVSWVSRSRRSCRASMTDITIVERDIGPCRADLWTISEASRAAVYVFSRGHRITGTNSGTGCDTHRSRATYLGCPEVRESYARLHRIYISTWDIWPDTGEVPFSILRPFWRTRISEGTNHTRSPAQSAVPTHTLEDLTKSLDERALEANFPFAPITLEVRW